MTKKRHLVAPQQGSGQTKMAIGEFDGAATLSGESGLLMATPMYWMYEMGLAALTPARAVADATRLFYKNPANPLAHTVYGKSVAASMELFERSTRRYGPPEWGIKETVVGGEHVPVHINAVWERPFCRCLLFDAPPTRRPRGRSPRFRVGAPVPGNTAPFCAARSKPFCPITK